MSKAISLDEAAKEYAFKVWEGSVAKTGYVHESIIDFKAGATWQQNQDKQVDEAELEKAFEWFNKNQWVGGKGDYNKGLFVKCNYKEIVLLYLKFKASTQKQTKQ